MNKPSVFQLVFIKLLQFLSPFIKSDVRYLKWYFFLYTGTWIDFNNVRTFSEKIQWLKLHNKDPKYTTIADKYLFKNYVEDILGPGYTFPLLGAWDSFEEIDFDELPDKFVLKTNHNSGGVWIIKDKSKIDYGSLKKDVEKQLSRNYYYPGREFPYKDIKHKIIAEQFMEEASGDDLKDYKVFCFDGKPTYIQVDLDRFIEHKRDFYDAQWNMMDFGVLFPRSNKRIEPPENLKEMIEIAKKLSDGFSFIRVDLFNIKGKIYVGELTFHPGGGVERFTPKEWDGRLGEMINLERYGA